MSVTTLKPHRKQHSRLQKTHAKGFTLIEVLISLLIMAVGLLGMTALQNEALKYNHAAFTESQTMFLINDIVERIRANRDANTYAINFIETVTAPTTNCAATSCSSAQMASWDIYEWRTMVTDSEYLPNGNSAITFDPITNEYTISISYEWTQLGGVDVTDGIRTVSVSTRIQ